MLTTDTSPNLIEQLTISELKAELAEIKQSLSEIGRSHQVCILWDVENVNPGPKSLFVDGLLEYATQFGNISVAKAFGDWSSNVITKMTPILSRNSFEMVHSYSPVKGKDSADFEMVANGLEVALKYPQLSTFVIVSGDIDFRPLVASLRRNGKEVYIIYDKKRVNESLLSLAHDYIDYRQIIPGDDDEIDQRQRSSSKSAGKSSPKKSTKQEREAGIESAINLLKECIVLMNKENRETNLSAVKVRMKILKPSFDESKLGFSQFSHFISHAESKGHITVKGKGTSMTISLKGRSKSESSVPYKKLIKVLKSLDGNSSPKFHKFSIVSAMLMDENFDYSKFGYNKFKKYILDLESRDYVDTKVEGLTHFVRIVK